MHKVWRLQLAAGIGEQCEAVQLLLDEVVSDRRLPRAAGRGMGPRGVQELFAADAANGGFRRPARAEADADGLRELVVVGLKGLHRPSSCGRPRGRGSR